MKVSTGNLRKHHFQSCWWLFIFFGAIELALAVEPLPEGFQRISGEHIDIITDLEIDESIRELPQVFDVAFPKWCELFNVSAKEAAAWHVEAFLMGARERFDSAGFIPKNLPTFRYGFQYQDQVWVTEQPSQYYRRHLLLHEGTHWFMNRKYTNHGPPWLMEGTAEWLGTHRWDGQHLELGVIPQTKDEVPYWGRITLIQQQLSEGIAPSLETILRYNSTAHQDVEAYAWSWAAVLFLRNHPRTAKSFELLLKQSMTPDERVTRWLFKRLESSWPEIHTEWNAMLTELEYGYNPERGFLQLSKVTAPLDTPAQATIDPSKTWQSAGVKVSAGQKIHVKCDGEFVVGASTKPWKSEPAGLTLEYYRGEPLGKVMLTVVASSPGEPDFSQPVSTIPIGKEHTIVAKQDGEVFLRINESNLGLSDNQGTLQVVIEKQ